MNLKTQKRLAADILKVGKSRVWMDPDQMGKIADAITREEIKGLIEEGVIQKKRKKGQKVKRKKKKQGIGSRKGGKKARKNKKKNHVEKVRTQRKLIKQLKEKEEISKETYKDLYKKVKGGFFRSRQHIKIYLKKKGERSES